MAPDLNTVPPSPRIPALTADVGGNSKPNILYIMADQLAAPLLKMYRAKSQIITPHLDALASQAVVFDSAYCPSPLCAPSRMSMVTGQLPTRVGAYDNACAISSDIPTYAHYLRAAGYETALAGKMHFIGEQLHGYESRLTSDIYPGDYGWSVNWDEPDTRLEWYHNASSILQAGPCVRSNQLDYDEEVMYKSTQFLYDHVRKGSNARPFCLTMTYIYSGQCDKTTVKDLVSLTHPHDPYTIEHKYWDMYEGVEIEMPEVRIAQEDQDAHSKRLLKVCDLWDTTFSDDQIRRARRAYYGAVSYVDDCIGRILKVLRDCRLHENTIIVFSGDHGDMLGERGLWYKMSYFESSVRVPLLVHYPKLFRPFRVSETVSTMDILPTLVDLSGSKMLPYLPIDGSSLLPLLRGKRGKDTAFAEYCGEGTISPMMMIRRGPWKFIICPADPVQLYNISSDRFELVNLAQGRKVTDESDDIGVILASFYREAIEKWDFKRIEQDVRLGQRQRRFVWSALKTGKFTSWDFDPVDDAREKYIRSHVPIDDAELRARYPRVDTYGGEIRN